jgi:lipopolysaccharide transport system ATP-binding protein
MSAVIRVENVSKLYSLKDVGAATIKSDLKRSWARLRGKEDPAFKLAESNDRTAKGDSDFVWALKDINFEVQQGEVLGILGKNGAGKSTLLKILSRVASPTTGSIRMKGRLLSLLEVGTGFHPDLSGRENIFLNGAILGMTKSEIKKNFDEIVDFSGIERYIDTPVKRYSSGMFVRLAFAVAAHLDPEILIIDEVLAVGDVEFQKKCISKMQEASRNQGRTVLFVSHNMSSIKTLCTNCILLEQGQVTMAGDVNKVVNYYYQTENRKIGKDGIIPDEFYRPYGTGEARFRAVYLVDEKGNKISDVRFRQKVKVHMEFEVLKPLQDVLVSFFVKNNDSQTIIFASEYENGFLPKDYKVGKYVIEADLDIALMPNHFTLSSSMYYFTGGAAIDYVENVYEFSVSNVAEAGKGDYPWTTVHGYINADAKWQHKSIKQ